MYIFSDLLFYSFLKTAWRFDQRKKMKMKMNRGEAYLPWKSFFLMFNYPPFILLSNSSINYWIQNHCLFFIKNIKHHIIILSLVSHSNHTIAQYENHICLSRFPLIYYYINDVWTSYILLHILKIYFILFFLKNIITT